MIKKDVTYGDWRIVRHDDSKMEVYKNGELCPKSAPVLREIAEEVGLDVNPDWRTSQLGSNVIKAVEALLECEEEPALNNDNSMETEYDFPISDKLKEIVKNIKSRMNELEMNSFVIYASDYWGDVEEDGDIDVSEYVEDPAGGLYPGLDYYDGGDYGLTAFVREIKLEDNVLSFVIDNWREDDNDSYSQGMNELDLQSLLTNYSAEAIEESLETIYNDIMFDSRYCKVVELNKLVQGL